MRLEVICNAGFEGWLWTSGRLERAELWDTPAIHPPAFSASFGWKSNRVLDSSVWPSPHPFVYLCFSRHSEPQLHRKAWSSLGTLIFSSLFISGPETRKPCKEAAVLQKRVCKGPRHRMHGDTLQGSH